MGNPFRASACLDKNTNIGCQSIHNVSQAKAIKYITVKCTIVLIQKVCTCIKMLKYYFNITGCVVTEFFWNGINIFYCTCFWGKILDKSISCERHINITMLLSLYFTRYQWQNHKSRLRFACFCLSVTVTISLPLLRGIFHLLQYNLKFKGLQTCITAITSLPNKKHTYSTTHTKRALSSASQQTSHTQTMISCCSLLPVWPEHPWRTSTQLRQEKGNLFSTINSTVPDPPLHFGTLSELLIGSSRVFTPATGIEFCKCEINWNPCSNDRH